MPRPDEPDQTSPVVGHAWQPRLQEPPRQSLEKDAPTADPERRVGDLASRGFHGVHELVTLPYTPSTREREGMTYSAIHRSPIRAPSP